MSGAGESVEIVVVPAASEPVADIELIADSSWLPGLATEINREHELAVESARDAVNRACRAGRLLFQAKKRVDHGEWKQWVADNLTISDRTAQRYMRVAAKLPRLPAQQAEHVKTLSLRQAIDYLKEPAGKAGTKKNNGGRPKTYTVSVLQPDNGSQPKSTPVADLNSSPPNPPAPGANPTAGLPAIPPDYGGGTLATILNRMALIFTSDKSDNDRMSADAALSRAWGRFRDEDKPVALREIKQRIDRLVELHRRLSGEV